MKYTVIPAPRVCMERTGKGLAVLQQGDPVELSERLRAQGAAGFGFSVEECALDDCAARCGAALPEGFTRREGYVLCVEDGAVRMGFDTDAGRFYAYSTLSQLLATAQVGEVPPLCIIDWPQLETRGFNLCYHVISERLLSLAPNFDFLLRMVRVYANMKMNAALIEFESMFPFQRHPLLHCAEGFTPEQMRELARVCAECHVEIIPLVQALGHAYYVLRHPEYAHLREVPRTTQQYCPCNPECEEFYFGLAQEILDMFPGVRRWHMGGDESRRLAECPVCAEKMKQQGMSHLYADHMNRVAQWFLERGITPMSWGDIFEEHPETLGVLDKRITICYWNYDVVEWYRAFLMQKIQRAGYRVLGCAAAKFGRCSDHFYLYQKSMRNVSVMASESARIGNAGTLLTDWPKHSTYETSVISNAYSAQISWSGGVPQEAFARRFALVFFGAPMDNLDEMLCMLGELSFGNMKQQDDIWVMPYGSMTDGQSVDGLDRFDGSRIDAAVQAQIAENVRQEVSPRTVATLELALARAARARELADAYAPGVRRNADVFRALELAADSMKMKADVGLAIDEAVKLLKYPLPGEDAARGKAARRVESALDEWKRLRARTGEVLAPTNLAGSLACNLQAKFPEAMDEFLSGCLRALKAGSQVQGLLNFKLY